MNLKKTLGFTLIELMISITLSLFVIGAVATIYITTITGSSDTMKSAQLNHDLGTTALLMVNDIRRAGYWGGAVTGSDAKDNPFTQATTNIQIPNASCILYTYDGGDGMTAGVNHDSNANVDGDEYYGFRLNNGTIQMRLTGSTTSDCDDGTWIDLLDSAVIDITALAFSFVPTVSIPNITATSSCLNASTQPNEVVNKACNTAITDGDISSGNILETRQVLYTIIGTLDDDATVVKTLSGSVNVRNNRIFVNP